MKAKNKILTFLILSSGAAAVTAALNKIIKAQACSKNLLRNTKFSYFKWRLGNVSYTKSGNGKPLLLIHDLNAASGSFEWSRMIPLLQDEYTVYAINLLGCGSSEKANITYTNYLYVQLICDFIKSEIGHRANVIATGESASIPIMACANNPELFGQLMLINPLSLQDYSQIPGRRARFYKTIIEFPILGTLLYNIASRKKAIVDELRADGFYNPHCIKSSWIDSCYEAAHLGSFPKFLYASQRCNYTKCNITNALKKIDNSICLVGGAATENIAERLEEYRACNPAIEISLIPDTKGLPHLEKPDKVLELIKTYLT